MNRGRRAKFMVISGGQDGADYAALMIAQRLGLKTGGWMPKGFLTLSGPNPRRAFNFNLKEHSSNKYPPRTFANARLGDMTIMFWVNPNSAGEALTRKACQHYNKPVIEVNMRSALPPAYVAAKIIEAKVRTLNVAGHGESRYSGTFEFVCKYMVQLLMLIPEDVT